MLRILSSFILSAILLLAPSRPANAACNIIVNIDDPNQADEQLASIGCVLEKGLEVGMFSAGAIFVALVLFAAIKFSLSQGDAKGIEGAKQAFTWAVVGFIGAISVVLIINMVAGWFGVTDINPLSDAITRFVDSFN